MLNEQIIVDATAHLDQRRANVADLDYEQPVACQFSSQQIQNGARQQALKRWLARRLGENVRRPALYVIEVNNQDAALVIRAAFDAAKQVANRGYALPKRNGEIELSPVLYVGSSQKDIQRRLLQHLWQAPIKTYALNLNRWMPAINGTVRVSVQSIPGAVNPVVVQDAEDALWRSLRPMFGKSGGR